MGITKLFTTAKEVNLLSDSPIRFNTSGYKSAKLVVTINTPTSGSLSFNLRGNTDSEYLVLNNKELGATTAIGIDYRGGNFKREYLVDLSLVNSCKISFSGTLTATKATAELYFSYAELQEIEAPKAFDIYSNGSVEFPLTHKLFKATLGLIGDPDGNAPVENNVIVVINLFDGESWSGNVNFVNDSGVETNNVQIAPSGEKRSLWLDTSGYTRIRIKANTLVRSHNAMGIEVEQTNAFEREYKLANVTNFFTKCGGGKYLKLLFNGMSLVNGAGQIRIAAKNASGEFIQPVELQTLDGKPIKQNVLSDITLKAGSGSDLYTVLYLFGDVINGGIIFKYAEDFTPATKITYSVPATDANKIRIDGAIPSYTRSVSCVISSSPITPVETLETCIVSRNKYDIYHYGISGKVVDAVNEDVLVKLDTNRFKYYRFGLYGICYDVVLDSEHCPSLLPGEDVKFVKLINYENVSFTFSMTRILLFTTKNRILYNRVKNETTGISYFREAPLYNKKKRFYPVNDKSLASDVAKYLPIFPEYNYNQFAGRINGSDEFGIALPERGSSVGTLLEDWRRDDEIGKVAYSSFVLSNDYGCVYGHYNSADGDPWVAVSKDGKEFFIIETWAVVEDYVLRGITTMKVDLSSIVAGAGGYVSGSIKATRRIYNVPTSENKEPSTPFIIGDSCVINSITVEDGRTYLSFIDDSPFRKDEMTTHKFNEMAPIVFLENVSADSEYDYICNSVKADGSDNSGIYFRLHRVDTNKYELLGDAGDPFEGKLVCRHIHSVSESYGGFLVATGENYRHLKGVPFFDGGFLFFITADRRIGPKPLQYTLSDVMDNFYGTFRITSSEKAINRACGAVLRGDKKIVFVSDGVQGDKDVNDISIEGRTEKMGSRSFGVYLGLVKDCDDWGKYQNVCNMYSPGLGLVENLGRLAVCGYAGPIQISPDFGNTWYQEVVSRKYIDNPEAGSTIDVTGLDNDGCFYYGNNKIVWKE